MIYPESLSKQKSKDLKAGDKTVSPHCFPPQHSGVFVCSDLCWKPEKETSRGESRVSVHKYPSGERREEVGKCRFKFLRYSFSTDKE